MLLQLYYALVHPHFLYGLSVWGSMYPSYFAKLSTLQNKAVKIVGGGKIFDRATPFYTKLNIPKRLDLHTVKIAKLTYNFINRPNLLPKMLSDICIKATNVSQKQTRSSIAHTDLLYIPRYRSNKLQRSLKYQSVKVWNSIPPEIRNSSSRSFSDKLKKHLTIHY